MRPSHIQTLCILKSPKPSRSKTILGMKDSPFPIPSRKYASKYSQIVKTAMSKLGFDLSSRRWTEIITILTWFLSQLCAPFGYCFINLIQCIKRQKAKKKLTIKEYRPFLCPITGPRSILSSSERYIIIDPIFFFTICWCSDNGASNCPYFCFVFLVKLFPSFFKNVHF
jgi:hypothetical protein